MAGRPLASDAGRSGVVGQGGGLDLADEADAAAVHGPDPFLLLAVVADGAAGGLDAAGQGGVGDDAPVPHDLDQLVLADEPAGIARQVADELEHLRLDRRQRAGAPELERLQVDLDIPEAQTGRHCPLPSNEGQVTPGAEPMCALHHTAFQLRRKSQGSP